MGCSISVTNAPNKGAIKREKQVRITANVIEDDSKTRESNERLKTTRTNLAKYILKFPRIKKAYRHLLMGWCEAIEKKISEDSGSVFSLCGPRDQASKALALSGILTTNAYIEKALDSGVTSPRPNKDIITFKEFVIAVCWLKKFGDEDALKKSSDDEKNFKYGLIMNGLKIVLDMFEQIDIDGSGEITYDEFREAFAGLGDDEIHEQRIKELDFDNDKEITYPEFCLGIAVWVGFVDEQE